MGLTYSLKKLFRTPPPPQRSRRRIYGNGYRRGYEAAKVDRLVADWVTSIRSTDAELLTALCVMRARSRDLTNKDD